MTVSPAFLNAYKGLVEKSAPSFIPSSAEMIKKLRAKLEAIKGMDIDSPQFIKELDEFMRTLGIEGAGAIPESLMARQDLEGKTTKFAKTRNFKEYWKDCADRALALLDEVKEEVIDIDSQVHEKNVVSQTCTSCGSDYNYNNELTTPPKCPYCGVSKGVIEQTGKKLDTALKDAADADTRAERKSVVDTIKEVQLRRQKATIAERSKEAAGKNFKQVWGGIKHIGA